MIRIPDALARYVAPKGSICVDGISLTVNEVDGAVFGVNIVPHTMAMTTLADTTRGDPVNIESRATSLLASEDWPAAGITRDTLARTGFLGDPAGDEGH